VQLPFPYIKTCKFKLWPLSCLGVKLGLAFKEKHRLRMSENRVLRGTSGPKRDEVTGGWRKLRNEELNNWYSSTSIRLTK
jgi:hypothetical protein